jgi:hypothetical protein
MLARLVLRQSGPACCAEPRRGAVVSACRVRKGQSRQVLRPKHGQRIRAPHNEPAWATGSCERVTINARMQQLLLLSLVESFGLRSAWPREVWCTRALQHRDTHPVDSRQRTPAALSVPTHNLADDRNLHVCPRRSRSRLFTDLWHHMPPPHSAFTHATPRVANNQHCFKRDRQVVNH